VLAALDNGPAAEPVLAAARAVARLLGAEVDAMHVRTDGDRLARAAAQAAGLELLDAEGPVVDALVGAGEETDVALLALGARGTPGGPRPLGSTALAVATTLAKPVVIVPPEARDPGRIDRVLVPLEGTVSSSLAPRRVIELARDARLEVVVLHVHQEGSIPAFTDQPQHEELAWSEEFMARYCPWGLGVVRFDVRVGRCEEIVPRFVEECGADLVALGWAGELAKDRARVVRAALTATRVPVMLIPVELAVRE
jgi:nucleotide-binding universal stress UspA family protein